MRWTDFFTHLEHDFALDAHSPRESGGDHDGVDADFLDICARAKVARRPVTVGLVTGEVFHVSPRAVSAEWFSGLVGGDRGAGVVIPVSAITWLESDAVSGGSQKTALVSATLREVLTDIARRQSSVTIRTLRCDYAGVIVRVGDGFCDVAGQPDSASGSSRRFPFKAIISVCQGSAVWG